MCFYKIFSISLYAGIVSNSDAVTIAAGVVFGVVDCVNGSLEVKMGDQEVDNEVANGFEDNDSDDTVNANGVARGTVDCVGTNGEEFDAGDTGELGADNVCIDDDEADGENESDCDNRVYVPLDDVCNNVDCFSI